MEKYTPNWKKQQVFLKFSLIGAALLIAAIVALRWSSPTPQAQSGMTAPVAKPQQPTPAEGTTAQSPAEGSDSPDLNAAASAQTNPANPGDQEAQQDPEAPEFKVQQEANAEN